jgi:hypothetical protein
MRACVAIAQRTHSRFTVDCLSKLSLHHAYIIHTSYTTHTQYRSSGAPRHAPPALHSYIYDTTHTHTHTHTQNRRSGALRLVPPALPGGGGPRHGRGTCAGRVLLAHGMPSSRILRMWHYVRAPRESTSSTAGLIAANARRASTEAPSTVAGARDSQKPVT